MGFVGSTKQIHDFVAGKVAEAEELSLDNPKFAIMTECSMSSELQIEFPHIEFAGACHYCPHMMEITVANTYHALRTMLPEYEHERHNYEVLVDEPDIAPSQVALNKMNAVQPPKGSEPC